MVLISAHSLLTQTSVGLSSSPPTSYPARCQCLLTASLLTIWMCTEHSEAPLQHPAGNVHLRSQFATVTLRCTGRTIFGQEMIAVASTLWFCSLFTFPWPPGPLFLSLFCHFWHKSHHLCATLTGCAPRFAHKRGSTILDSPGGTPTPGGLCTLGGPCTHAVEGLFPSL